MKRILLSTLISLLLFFSLGTGAFAATVGDKLEQPEEGWTRYDDKDINITYTGSGWFNSTNGASFFYNGSETVTNNATDSSFSFNFVGSKVRLITTVSSLKTQSYVLTLDGVDYPYTQYNDSAVYQYISFEKLDLPYGEHSVKISSSSSGQLGLDAVDVDGILKLYDPDAIATPSPEPEPNPTEPEQPKGDRAILVVTMTTGLEKEYDLSMDEVNAFINWYDAKDAGSGPSKYAIDKHNNNKGPFSKRTDYVIFNNILTFEVNEYTVK